MSVSSESPDAFTIERHGEVLVIKVSPAMESMDSTLAESAAALVLEPLRKAQLPQVVFDMERLPFFGSSLLAVLIRCWKLTKVNGGTMVLAGVSPHARDLLRITKLDLVWPMYDSRHQAIESLMVD